MASSALSSIAESNRSPRKLTMRGRTRGNGLPELVVLMSVISVTLMLSVRLMARAVSVHQVAVACVMEVRMAEELEQRLRRDLSRCRKIQATDTATVVLTLADDQQVRYSVSKPDSRELVRSAPSPGPVNSPDTVNKPDEVGDLSPKPQSIPSIDRWQLLYPSQLKLSSQRAANGQQVVRVRIEPISGSATTASVLEVVGVCDEG